MLKETPEHLTTDKVSWQQVSIMIDYKRASQRG